MSVIKKGITMNYELTKETKIDIDGIILYRIIASKDFRDVKKGDLGGWVSKDAKILDSAWVYGEAVVRDNSTVRDNVKVKDNVIIKDNAIIRDNALVSGNATVRDNAMIKDNAVISGGAIVKDKAIVKDSVMISSNAEISGNVIIRGFVIISGNAIVKDKARVSGHAVIRGFAIVKDNAKIRGNAVIENIIPCFQAYNYYANPVPSKKGNLVRLGRYMKSRAEWIIEFWDNEKEFPRGSDESKDRLKALNMCLVWYGDELIKYEDLL